MLTPNPSTPPLVNRGLGSTKGTQSGLGAVVAEQGGGCPVASGRRQGPVTVAEVVSQAERIAKLCAWQGLKRLPLLLGQTFPAASSVWLGCRR